MNDSVSTRFAQKLVHTEKKHRDKAFKALTRYISKKSEWTDLDLDKIWKSLFYCMWMSDKAKIQHELAANLAKLVHRISDPSTALRFNERFFHAMHREWHGIDGLRLDKFYALIRKSVHEVFLFLKHHEWNTELVERFSQILSGKIVSQKPNGLRLHIFDLFLKEIYTAAGNSINSSSFVKLIQPFLNVLHEEHDKVVLRRVRDVIFKPLLNEYTFGNIEEDAIENEGTDDDEDDYEKKNFKDVNLEDIQHKIFQIAAADDTPERNRTMLYEIYSQMFAITGEDSSKHIICSTIENTDENLEIESQEVPNSLETKQENKTPKKSQEKIEKHVETPVEASKTPEAKQQKKTPKKNLEKIKNDSETPEVVSKTPEVKRPKKKTPKKNQENIEKKEETPEVVSETPEAKQQKKKTPKKNPEKIEKKEETPEAKQQKKTPKKNLEKIEKDSETPEVVSETPEAKQQNKKTPRKNQEKIEKVEETPAVKTPEAKQQKKKTPKKNQEKIENSELDPKAPEIKQRKKKTPKKSQDKKEFEDSILTKDGCTLQNKKRKLEIEESNDKKLKTDTSNEKKKKDFPSDNLSNLGFPRCKGCGGFGKGLLRKSMDMCNHCQRLSNENRKEKKRKKKQEQFQNEKEKEKESISLPESSFSTPKKVTFGKNKSLKYSDSVNRLILSAKKGRHATSANPATPILSKTPKTKIIKDSNEKKCASTGKIKKRRRAKASDYF